MQGFTGPVSPTERFPWDHAQPGLLMEKFDLSTVDPLAVCNDGSPAVMYMGPETSKTKWHFHIDGGFFCFDKMSCFNRARHSSTLVSSKGWEDKKNNSGMFDPHLGGFPDYQHATVGYCSSDAWMGQIALTDFTIVEGTVVDDDTGESGTFFHGYIILQAVLQKFINMGMGDTPDQELFVSGCSAGSIAATAMADSWQPRLEALGIKNPMKIWTMLDGAPIVSPPGQTKMQDTIVEMALKLVKMLYGQENGADPYVFLNPTCVAAEAEPTHCAWTGTVLPYIQTPNIVLNQLWDNFVTGQIYWFFNPTSPTTYKQGLNIVKMTRDMMKTVSPQQNYHAVGCGDHCISANPYFWRIIPNTAAEKINARDMTLQTRDALLKNDKSLLGRVVVDTCDDYNCGCIGQSSSYTKLSDNTLLFAVLNKMAPAMTMVNVPFTVALAIAASQTANPGQLFKP